jgi:hypothetical protein
MLIDSNTTPSHKRSPTSTQTNNLKKNKGAAMEISNSYNERPWYYKFWYGFPIMEEQAKLTERPLQEPISIANLLELGLNKQEAQELSTGYSQSIIPQSESK